MQQFKCHKTVNADKIATMTPLRGGMQRLIFGGAGGHQDVTDAWVVRHMPEVGGYVVIYDDGYMSYSPAVVFEAGYRAQALYLESIARVCHEVNRAYCQALGDDTQPAWEDAPEWQRQSALAGVNAHWQNPNMSPADSHASWYKQKEADGWKYGPVKDAEKKEHPCFVPYDQLPIEQRAKDYLFRAVVHTLK